MKLMWSDECMSSAVESYRLRFFNLLLLSYPLLMSFCICFRFLLVEMLPCTNMFLAERNT